MIGSQSCFTEIWNSDPSGTKTFTHVSRNNLGVFWHSWPGFFFWGGGGGGEGGIPALAPVSGLSFVLIDLKVYKKT